MNRLNVKPTNIRNNFLKRINKLDNILQPATLLEPAWRFCKVLYVTKKFVNDFR